MEDSHDSFFIDKNKTPEGLKINELRYNFWKTPFFRRDQTQMFTHSTVLHL